MPSGNSQSISALRPKLWQKTLYKDIMDNLYFVQNGLMGEGENNIVELKTGLMKGKGDTINYGLTAKLTGAGVDGDAELEGNEEKILPYSDAISIDKHRHAVRLDGKLDEQKNSYDMRSDAKDKLSIYFQEFIERQIFLKLGGVRNTALTDIAGVTIGASALWSNSPAVIPAADELAGVGNRYLCANYDPVSGTGGTPTLTANDKLTTGLIRRIRIKAQLSRPKIQPIKVGGKNYYVLFVHPYQANDLKEDENFKQALRNAQVRGNDNPLFTGAIGEWDGVVIHEHEYTPFLDVSAMGSSANFAGDSGGTQSAVDVFRAVLCGKQSIAFAKCNYDEGWVEKSFDYEDKVGFASGVMGGIQKVTFNSKEYGCIALDTAATNLS